ncbi:MAG: chemotaxis protein CheW [Pseudomonadota bacterium]
MDTVIASFAKLLEYEQRALGAAETDTGAAPQGDWAGLAFRVGDESLVCATDRVYESLPIPRITRVPGTKSFILGLANVRGNLITVIDLGCYLGGSPTGMTGTSRLLSATLRGRPVGLLVDEVFGQRNFMSSDAQTPTIPESSTFHGLVRKQHRAGTETWRELDLAILFSQPDFLDGSAA